MKTRAQLLWGTDEKPAAVRALKAGPLSVELSEGNLRAISWHGKEAVRAISYLVRDENWGTYAAELKGLHVQEAAGRFRVFYDAECRSGSGAVLCYKAVIEGDAEGRLSFDVTAVAGNDFRTNRCGFCILHPVLGVAGTPVRIEHTDGTVEESRFPAEIDPAQPFLDMRQITHTVAPGVTAICRMEGDAFEMEDQRNWTDASYKTYVRPLALPWPYTLLAGEPIRQTITLILSGVPSAAANGAGETVSIGVGDTIGTAPSFGFGTTPEETEATIAAIERLRELAPRHLVLHYNPLDGHDIDALRGFARLLDAFPAEATLEFVLPCRETPQAELAAAARAVAEAGLRLSAVAVSPAPDLKSTPPGSKWPDCPPFEEVYGAARRAFPGLPLGGGMFSYFTELNRKRPPADMLDFITHTTSPLVHAADDRSVMETLETLPFVTRSVRAIFGDKPYRIGPSSIGMRHNPYGARLADNPGAPRRMTMTADDPRQKGLFAAAWMTGYAAAVAEAGLTHLTLGAFAGSFGVIGDEGVRPAFFAAKALGSIAGKSLRRITSSDPSRVLALSTPDTLLIVNLTPETVEVRLPGVRDVSVLDESSALAALQSGKLDTQYPGDAVSLGAYGIAIATLGAP